MLQTTSPIFNFVKIVIFMTREASMTRDAWMLWKYNSRGHHLIKECNITQNMNSNRINGGSLAIPPKGTEHGRKQEMKGKISAKPEYTIL